MALDQSQKHKAFVYLMSVVELQRIFDDWPARVQIAVCLKQDGDCRMIVFREEEGRRFLTRLHRALGLRMSEICFYPEVPGLPTRKLLYSDEKQLAGLVRGSPDIVEEATDYSINFTFALDEGLDPVHFLHRPEGTQVKKDVVKKTPAEPQRKAPEATAPPPKPPQTVSAPAQEPAPPKQPAPKPAAADPSVTPLPSFLNPGATRSPGAAFKSMDQIRQHNAVPDTCILRAETNGAVAIDLPGCVGGTEEVSNPGRVFVRDDRRILAIQGDLLGPDLHKLPGRVVLSVKHLPFELREILGKSVGPARMSFGNGFLYIELAARERPVRSPQPALQRMRANWRLWASSAAMVGVVMVGLQSMFSPQQADDREGRIDWSQFQNTAPASSDEDRRSGGFEDILQRNSG